MHKKEIKAIVKKQLKREYPNWKRLTKNEKKEIATKVLEEVEKGYDFSKEIETPKHELLGIEQQTLNDEIMSIEEMERLIGNHKKSKLIRFDRKRTAIPYQRR